MELVLDTTDETPGPTFTLAGGWAWALCDMHAGGTWTLDILSPEGVWVSVSADDVAFTAVDILRFQTYAGAVCRFTGGTTGARIFCTNTL